MLIYTLHGLNPSWITDSCPKPVILGNIFSFLWQHNLTLCWGSFSKAFWQPSLSLTDPELLWGVQTLCNHPSCVSNFKEAQNLCSWIFSRSWLSYRSKHDPVKEEKHQWDRPLEQEGAGRMLYSLLHFAGCCSLWVHPPLPFHQIPSPSGQWQPRAEPHSLINFTFRSEMRAIISLHLLCTALCEVKPPHYFHMQSTQ